MKRILLCWHMCHKRVGKMVDKMAYEEGGCSQEGGTSTRQQAGGLLWTRGAGEGESEGEGGRDGEGGGESREEEQRRR